MIKNPIKITTMVLSNATKSRRLQLSARFKIVLVQQGHACWQIGHALIRISPGEIILLNNQEPRVFKEIAPPGEIKCLVVECEPSFLFTSPFHALFLGAWHEQARHRSGSLAMLRLMQEIEQENTAQEAFCTPVLCADTLHLLALVARACALPDQHRIFPDTGMLEAMRYISEHLADDLNVSLLAGIAHLSNSRFAKRFLAYNGISPMQYILRKRIEYAIELLEGGDATVIDIALQCGFQSSANFYKAFHKFAAAAPSDYRHGERASG